MMNTKKYVITGGPCVGKTTLLTLLHGKGQVVVPEAATVVMLEQENMDLPILPDTDYLGFQQKVMDKQLYLESTIGERANGHMFCDRGIVDNLAYYRDADIDVCSRLSSLLESHRYDKVFLLAPLPTYINTKVRKETSEHALKLHQHIRKAYIDCGYEPIDVPPLSSAHSRSSYVLGKIKRGD